MSGSGGGASGTKKDDFLHNPGHKINNGIKLDESGTRVKSVLLVDDEQTETLIEAIAYRVVEKLQEKG